MKAAKEFYEALEGMSAAADRLAALQRAKGHELAALLHYAEGREESDTRDAVVGLVLVVAGHRYLEKKEQKPGVMDSPGKRTFDQVIAAEKPETAIRELSGYALTMLLDHTDDCSGWVAQAVFGFAVLEATRRFRLDNQEPNFP